MMCALNTPKFLDNKFQTLLYQIIKKYSYHKIIMKILKSLKYDASWI